MAMMKEAEEENAAHQKKLAQMQSEELKRRLEVRDEMQMKKAEFAKNMREADQRSCEEEMRAKKREAELEDEKKRIEMMDGRLIIFCCAACFVFFELCGFIGVWWLCHADLNRYG